jgi:hypothetical protein
MKIYTFHNADNQAYLYSRERAAQRCIPDPPRSLAKNWLPPTFELVGSDEFHSYLPKTDFPTLTVAGVALSGRAVERLRPVLLACGEVLPIRLHNDQEAFYLFNITQVINAVDMRHSRFMELPSGAIGPCELLVFDPNKIPDDALFFKNTQMGPITEIFATQRAVDAVKRARLSGYEFRLAWSNDRPVQNRR